MNGALVLLVMKPEADSVAAQLGCEQQMMQEQCNMGQMQHGSNAIPVLFDDGHAFKGALQVVHIATQLHQLHV